MAKRKAKPQTIKVALEKEALNNTYEKEGTVTRQKVFFQIGDQRVAFLIHPPYEVENSPERVLTHWPTGARIDSLTPVKLRLSRDGAARVTDRDAAKELIEALIRHYTAEVLIERFASLPVINP